jgi:hypothetical protein
MAITERWSLIQLALLACPLPALSDLGARAERSNTSDCNTSGCIISG